MPEGNFENYQHSVSKEIPKTRERYAYPFSEQAQLRGIEVKGPSHEGPNEGSIDFLLPDGTDVLSPIDGKIITFIHDHDQGGPTQESEHTLNYLVLETPKGERCLLAHLAKESVHLSSGSQVKKGDLLAKTGSTGWTDTPHLHMQIIEPIGGNEYRSKNIQFTGKRADYKPKIRSLIQLAMGIIK